MKSPQPIHNLFQEAGSYSHFDNHPRVAEPTFEPPLDQRGAALLSQQGTAAFQAGHLDAAIACMQQAIQADSSSADYHNSLAVFYTTVERFAEAVACYQQALSLRPSFAVASNNLSLALTRMGRHEEALAAATQAVRLLPGFAQAHNHMGLALLALGQPEEAAEQCRLALQLQPDFAEARRNLGSALVEQGKLDEGVTCFYEALRLRPDLTDAHIVLAVVFKMQGRFEEAIAHLRQALRTAPNHALVWCNLSEFAAQGLCQLSEAELAHVRALLASNRPSPSTLDRSLLLLTLANVCDRRGAYDAAFSHYQQAGTMRKAWLRENGQDFDAAAHQHSNDQLISAFDEAFFQQPHPGGNDSELPIFVVGMPRSGTTLVEQILSSHSRVAGAGELPDFSRIAAQLKCSGERRGGNPACLRFVEQSDLRCLADRYLKRLTEVGGPAAVRVVDKMPENFLYLGAIAMAFPRARVIHCRRDPLDVCMSCFVQNFKGVNYSWSLEDLGNYYREYERLMAHWRRVLPLRMMEIRYEDLVAHQETASRELIAFCGLEWEARCLAFHNNPRPVQTVSAVQVRRPMYSTSIGRWTHYNKHLEPLQQALGING